MRERLTADRGAEPERLRLEGRRGGVQIRRRMERVAGSLPSEEANILIICQEGSEAGKGDGGMGGRWLSFLE